MSTVFTFEEFQAQLKDFFQTLPVLLGRVPDTSDLVMRINALQDSVESPFTVAVMGQMKAGKSTLVNALVGRDLASTGVTETTATTNWFRFSSSVQDLDRFCVHWKDSPESSPPQEYFHLSHIHRWLGDSDLAKRTSFLEFFTDSTFLLSVNLVDTPGTRSTIGEHTESSMALVSGALDESDRAASRLHEESSRQARTADALLYVLTPLGRASDAAWLDEFDGATRIPGSHPYNSIGVVHKWESLLESNDPYAEVLRRVERLQHNFQDKLSCLIPVSAPLKICHDRLRGDGWFWDSLFRLGRESSDQAISIIIGSEDYFVIELAGCGLSGSEREAWRDRILEVYPGMPWGTIQLLVKTAHYQAPHDVDALRALILEMSGFDRLQRELDTRYFARTRTIKAFSILAKASPICAIAETRLRNRKDELGRLLTDARSAESVLRARVAAGDQELARLLNYVAGTLRTVEREFMTASETIRSLSHLSSPIRDAYDDMNREIEALSEIDQSCQGLAESDRACLRMLLGSNGTDICSRMKAFPGVQGTPTSEDIEDAILRVRRMFKPGCSTAENNIMDLAVTRLAQIAGAIETTP